MTALSLPDGGIVAYVHLEKLCWIPNGRHKSADVVAELTLDLEDWDSRSSPNRINGNAKRCKCQGIVVCPDVLTKVTRGAVFSVTKLLAEGDEKNLPCADNKLSKKGGG